METGIV